MLKIPVVVVNHFQSKDSFLSLFRKGVNVDIDLTQIEVSGLDSYSYLFRQITNEFKNSQGDVSAQSILDGKGKIIAPFSLECLEENKFLITCETSFKSQLLERIELYHISEDFEVIEKNQKVYCYWGAPFYALALNKYLNFSHTFHYSHEKLNEFETIDAEDFKFYSGYLNCNNKFLNETRYMESAYSASKGCFPGAETVSKLKTGRGAAFFPALLSGSSLSTDLKVDKKIIGKFIKNNDLMNYVELLRDYRIDQREFTFEDHRLKVNLYPCFPETTEELATALYEGALEAYASSEESSDEVISVLETVIEICPTFEDAYEMLGVILGRSERYHEAITWFEFLEKLNNESIMAKTNLSLYHMKIGNIEIAEKYKDESTFLSFKKAGKDFEIKESEDKRLEELKRRGELFKQVIEIDEKDEVALNGLGEIHYELKSYDESLKFYLAAFDVNKRNSKTCFGLGKIYLELADLDKSKEYLERALSLAAKSGNMSFANEVQKLISKT